jgi:urease accessory protein
MSLRSSTRSLPLPGRATVRAALVAAVAAMCAALPLAASAHVGADAAAHHGFLAGLLHPFTGLDHLAAMLAVGFWSARSGVQRVWAAPLAFAAMVLAGALLARGGLVLPAIEPMIAASLVALGLLIAAQARLGSAAMAAIAGAFALFHGAAHGIELGGGAALGGMLAGTVVLHVLGIGLGRALPEGAASRWIGRLAGGSVALFGTALLVPALAAI